MSHTTLNINYTVDHTLTEKEKSSWFLQVYEVYYCTCTNNSDLEVWGRFVWGLNVVIVLIDQEITHAKSTQKYKEDIIRSKTYVL